MKGEVGAVATPDEKADGCHLMKLTSEPFHCEKRQDLVAKGKCLNPADEAPSWHTESVVEVTHLLNHVVLGLVLMEKISEANQLAWGCKRQEATRLKARRVSRHGHDCIIEETIRREALEPPDCEGMKKEHGRRLAQRLLKDGEKEQPK